MDYFLHILIYVAIYVILATSFNLIVGFTGQFSVAHAAFYGIGAYTAALLQLKLGFSFLPSVVLAALVAACFSIVVAVPALRIAGDYLVMATFALQILATSLFNNVTPLTNGPAGLRNIPRPSIFGWMVEGKPAYLLLTAVLTALCWLLIYQLVRSPFGRALRALRDDEVAALSLGKNVAALKIAAFLIGSGLAGVAGALYAGYITYINPDSFTLYESILIMAIVVIGGTANVYGSLVGAALLVALPEVLRFFHASESFAAAFRQMLYGLLLVLVIRFRPQGLIGEHDLREPKQAPATWGGGGTA